MIDIDIPGFGEFALKHLVLEYGGVLALDGNLLPGAREVLALLAPVVEIHVVTADSFGIAEENLAGLPVKLTLLTGSDQADAKLDLVKALGADSVAAIGNGRNDRKMLEAAAVGIFVIQKQGGAVRAMSRADVVCTHILEALDLLRHPKRLVETLGA